MSLFKVRCCYSRLSSCDVSSCRSGLKKRGNTNTKILICFPFQILTLNLTTQTLAHLAIFVTQSILPPRYICNIICITNATIFFSLHRPAFSISTSQCDRPLIGLCHVIPGRLHIRCRRQVPGDAGPSSDAPGSIRNDKPFSPAFRDIDFFLFGLPGRLPVGISNLCLRLQAEELLRKLYTRQRF